MNKVTLKIPCPQLLDESPRFRGELAEILHYLVPRVRKNGKGVVEIYVQ